MLKKSIDIAKILGIILSICTILSIPWYLINALESRVNVSIQNHTDSVKAHPHIKEQLDEIHKDIKELLKRSK